MPILNWLNRDKTIKESAKVPYRLLKAKDEFSYGDKKAENMIIQGDNLDGLKALLPYYAGKVKCIYIDPPFNTGNAFEHYDDGLEHSIWLSLIKNRLELLRQLLSEDGIIFMHLDNAEMAYAKVLMDEIFGRCNYLNTISMSTNAPSGFKATSSKIFSTSNYILIFAKNKIFCKLNKVFIEKDYDKSYNKVLLNKEDHYSEWKYRSISEHVALLSNFNNAIDARKSFGKQDFDKKIAEFAIQNSDIVFRTAAIGGGAKIKRKHTIEKSKIEKGKVFVHPNEDVPGFYILNGEGLVFYKGRIVEIEGNMLPGEILTDVWTDIGWTGIAGEGGIQFKNGKKPEKLIKRCIELSTNENDLVLDSFLGSGTTAAVAHKMNRRYIGIEMGEHAKTHCVERLKKVVDGEQGGISKSVNWQGGGGFRFYELGEAIFDDQGKINKNIKFEHLAAHIWFSETKTPFIKKDQNNPYSPFLGIHQGVAYYLLYNGILGDKRPHGGNVLTSKILSTLEEIKAKNFTGEKVIYGETSRIGPAKLLSKKITFKQTPYDIKSR